MQLSPIVKKVSQYTDEERAIIAGYLLKQRAGTLLASQSSERGAQLELDIGLDKQAVYYRNAEAYSRFLLYWAGYPVHKDRMYGEA